MSKQDTHFFNTFSVVLGLLAGFALLVFAFARHIGATTQLPQMMKDPLLVRAIDERTRPPVRVAVAGQDNTALKIEAAGPAQGAGFALPVPKDGPDLYETACKACHGAGIAGAPKMGDKAAWVARIKEGMPTLYEHATKGYQGKQGVMPAKGGRADLSDELIHAGVDYMVSQSR
ncbi:MAG: c-type cytochrome [Steroidobacteraceae bacterium]